MEKCISSYSDKWEFKKKKLGDKKYQSVSVNNQSQLVKDWAKFTTNQRSSTVSLGFNSSIGGKPTLYDNIRIKFNNYLLESAIGTV